MGMKISSIQLAVELKMNGVFDNVKNIIDMGTQEIRINYELVIYFLKTDNKN